MPTKPTQKSKYKGILNVPRKPWGPISLLDDAGKEVARRQAVDAAEFVQRLDLLFDHYRIASGPTAHIALLHALIVDHVPGFGVAKGRGAERYWTADRTLSLALAVREHMEAGCSQAEAIRRVEKSGKFRAGSLTQRYQEARSHPVVTGMIKIIEASE